MEQSISQQQSSVSGGFPPSSPGIVSSAPNSGSTGSLNFPSPIQMQNAGPLGNSNAAFMDIPSSSPGPNIPGKPDVDIICN